MDLDPVLSILVGPDYLSRGFGRAVAAGYMERVGNRYYVTDLGRARVKGAGSRCRVCGATTSAELQSGQEGNTGPEPSTT